MARPREGEKEEQDCRGRHGRFHIRRVGIKRRQDAWRILNGGVRKGEGRRKALEHCMHKWGGSVCRERWLVLARYFSVSRHKLRRAVRGEVHGVWWLFKRRATVGVIEGEGNTMD